MTDQGVTPIVPSGTGKLQGSAKRPPPKTTEKSLDSLSCPVAKFFSGSLRIIYRWWVFAVTYCVVLGVGLYLITIRQRAQYIAALDLKADHLIQSSDFRPPINRIPRIFQVDQKIIVGKYLKNDIDSGKPIWQNSVSSAPIATTDSQGDVVQVRLAEGTASAKFLQPKSKVVLSSTNSDEKSEGVIIGTSTKTAVRGSKGETGATGERKPSPKPSTQLSPHN
jgi:hypothetical protein